MLKVYISADIEGVNGIVYPSQISKMGGDDYFKARKQQILELNYLIQATFDAGATHVTVNDAHSSMDNIDILELHPHAELITGKPKLISMMHGLDETYSCVIFAGYHAMAGNDKGVLSHTFSTIFRNIYLNNEEIGEIGLNSIFAGIKNVPVSFLYGDIAACEEVKDFLGDISTVWTKQASSTTSAICKPNAKLIEELKITIQNALKNQKNWKIKKTEAPYELKISFSNKEFADLASLLPFIKRISPFEIVYKDNEFENIYRLLQFLAGNLTLPA
ncbi:MAG: M55 family metallopeptidase [bacterium]